MCSARRFHSGRTDEGAGKTHSRRFGGHLPITVVRLGSPRRPGEGLRLGTVRRPPRGVPKAEVPTRDFYDLWLPILAPSRELVAFGRSSRNERSWNVFRRRFRAEMNEPEAARVLDLLAALSRQADFSLGCYCEDEAKCHRSLLRELLAERAAVFDANPAAEKG